MHLNFSCLPGDAPDNRFPTVHMAVVQSVNISEISYGKVAKSKIPTFDILNLQTKHNLGFQIYMENLSRSLKLKIQ